MNETHVDIVFVPVANEFCTVCICFIVGCCVVDVFMFLCLLCWFYKKSVYVYCFSFFGEGGGGGGIDGNADDNYDNNVMEEYCTNKIDLLLNQFALMS